MTSLAHFETLAGSIKLPSKAVIDGKLVTSASGAVFDNMSPRNGQLINRIALCSDDDADLAVAAARRSFEDGRWRKLHYRDKKRIMFRLADLMERDLEVLALLESLDSGKPIRDTTAFDVPSAVRTLRYYAEALDKVHGEVGPETADRFSYAVHEPLGVIGAIMPWNFPIHLTMWKVAPALAMGNSLVVKPAELTSMTALKLGELALEAGVPAGVLNIITGKGSVAGKAIALHMDVDMLTFTGSGPVGRMLMKYAADSNLKRVSLELGGKSPHIIFADCPDLDAAAMHAAFGIFYNQGEVCTAGSRLLVENKVRDSFLDKLVAAAKTYVPGDPLEPATNFGAMVSESQMNTVLGYIDTARKEGAGLALGGKRVRPESGGYFVEPTVFDNVAPASTLSQEEVFGPVLAVTPFRDANEALAIANNTVFGLASGVWTRDISLAHRAAREIKAGLVWINGWDSCDITMPFGGFKQSGFGRDRSLHALYKYADLKSVSITIR